MPSTQRQPLNPRLPSLAAPEVVAARGVTPSTDAPVVAKLQIAPKAAKSAPARDEPKDLSRDGGFHESSYELSHGLEISESEWPEETTIPGALGER